MRRVIGRAGAALCGVLCFGPGCTGSDAPASTLPAPAGEVASPAAPGEVASPEASAAPREGANAPAFSLPNHGDGGAVSLDSLLARGPAVIVFYRGDW